MKNHYTLIRPKINTFSHLFIFLLLLITPVLVIANSENTKCIEEINYLGGGPEIKLTIIGDECQGETGVLSFELTGEATYLWSTGETTSSILITENGTYSVTAIVLATGATLYDDIVVTELDPNGAPFSGFTILAKKEVKLEKFNVVATGAVGATDSDGKIELKYNTNVFSFVQADDIKIDASSYADDEITTPAEMDLPDFVYNTFSEDADDLKVEEGETLTISGNVYKKIEVKKNAKLIIDAENVFAKEVKVEDGAEVEFTGCTNLILEKGMDLKKNTSFNITEQNVEVYADYSVDVDEGSIVVANIYVNDKDIKAKGKDGNPTTMKGFFSGDKVEGKYYVSWEFGNLCSPCPIVYPEPTTGTCECEGGMTQLTIEYTGGAGANLTTNSGVVTDNGDGTYTVNTASGEDKLEKNFEITDGNTVGEVHTSCSKDILGNTYGGSFKVLGYVDTENNITTIETCPVSIECDCKGGMSQLTISYSGTNGANLTVNSGVIQDNGDSTYTISAASGDKLEKNFEIYDGHHLGEIHTSCSQDILGVTFAGVYEVIEHVDSEGSVCSVDSFNSSLIDNNPVIAFPNPTKSSFNLYVQSSKDMRNIQVNVFSITNKNVLEQTIQANQNYIIGENLQPGFYLVRIEMEDQVKVLKVIKN